MSSQDHSRAGALIIQEIITILFLINTPRSETLSTAWQRGGGYGASIGGGVGAEKDVFLYCTCPKQKDM